MESRFDFPDDRDKTPLVSVNVTLTEKDIYDMAQALYFRSGGFRVQYIVGIVLFMLFFANVALLCIMSGDFISALVYAAITAIAALSLCMPKHIAKGLYRKPPYNSGYHSYSFYLHHFDYACEYRGAAISYDMISSGRENVSGFILTMADGTYHYIPKSGLSDDTLHMLHAVMENKLGSKFSSGTF